MRPVAAIGFIALAFGLASYQVLGEWNAFNVVNLAAGAVGVALGAVAAAGRFARRTAAADRGPTIDAVLITVPAECPVH